MSAKNLEERVAERPTDQALRFLAVEVSATQLGLSMLAIRVDELQMQIEAQTKLMKKHIEAKE